MEEIKLTIELVPKTAWFDNLRSRLSTFAWNKIRKACYAKAGHKCEICGGVGKQHPVECHEIWHYNDKDHIQTLKGVIALCPSCHSVKHFGLARIMGRDNQAFRHLIQVNEWSAIRGHQYVDQAFALYESRSSHDWTINLDWLKENL